MIMPSIAFHFCSNPGVITDLTNNIDLHKCFLYFGEVQLESICEETNGLQKPVMKGIERIFCNIYLRNKVYIKKKFAMTKEFIFFEISIYFI